MAKQKECANCNGPWEWDCIDVHNFNLPVAKRIWPAVCTQCRVDLEQRYKNKQLTYTELIMEFSTISAKASKKCALSQSDVQNILLQMKTYTPKKRGK